MHSLEPYRLLWSGAFGRGSARRRQASPSRCPSATTNCKTRAKDGPILVVSNRLPVTLQRGPRGLERRRSTGGLVSALEPVLRKRGGTWIGWPGTRLAEGESVEVPGDPYRLRAVPLSESEVSRYYHGLSNRTLWPLFHSFPGRTRFDDRDWRAFEEVNARFADAATDEAGESDLIWVHDYHLARTPLHVRRLRPDGRAGGGEWECRNRFGM